MGCVRIHGRVQACFQREVGGGRSSPVSKGYVLHALGHAPRALAGGRRAWACFQCVHWTSRPVIKDQKDSPTQEGVDSASALSQSCQTHAPTGESLYRPRTAHRCCSGYPRHVWHSLPRCRPQREMALGSCGPPPAQRSTSAGVPGSGGHIQTTSQHLSPI